LKGKPSEQRWILGTNPEVSLHSFFLFRYLQYSKSGSSISEYFIEYIPEFLEIRVIKRIEWYFRVKQFLPKLKDSILFGIYFNRLAEKVDKPVVIKKLGTVLNFPKKQLIL
jgi:hypothetical protein